MEKKKKKYPDKLRPKVSEFYTEELMNTFWNSLVDGMNKKLTKTEMLIHLTLSYNEYRNRVRRLTSHKKTQIKEYYRNTRKSIKKTNQGKIIKLNYCDALDIITKKKLTMAKFAEEFNMTAGVVSRWIHTILTVSEREQIKFLFKQFSKEKTSKLPPNKPFIPSGFISEETNINTILPRGIE